jgi:hypothetical protein
MCQELSNWLPTREDMSCIVRYQNGEIVTENMIDYTKKSKINYVSEVS